MSYPNLIKRSNNLLETARFMTLATHGPDGVWASTVNYVPLRRPLRLLWYSLRSARHSVNIESTHRLSGSIFLTGVAGDLGIDGAQFTGTACSVEADRVAELSDSYYRRNFPDELVRRRWRLPVDVFHGTGPRRFYLLTVEKWWLYDIDGWLKNMNDQRVSVPLSALHTYDDLDSGRHLRIEPP